MKVIFKFSVIFILVLIMQAFHNSDTIAEYTVTFDKVTYIVPKEKSEIVVPDSLYEPTLPFAVPYGAVLPTVYI